MKARYGQGSPRRWWFCRLQVDAVTSLEDRMAFEPRRSKADLSPVNHRQGPVWRVLYGLEASFCQRRHECAPYSSVLPYSFNFMAACLLPYPNGRQIVPDRSMWS